MDARDHVFIWGSVELELESGVLIFGVTNTDAEDCIGNAFECLNISHVEVSFSGTHVERESEETTV